MTLDPRQRDKRKWEFALPTGEVVEISLPEKADPDWADKIEEVVAKIEKIYPYMGFRPGILPVVNFYLTTKGETSELGNIVNQQITKNGNIPSYTYHSDDQQPRQAQRGLSQLAWGHNDVIPQGQMQVGTQDTADAPIRKESPMGWASTPHDEQPYIDFVAAFNGAASPAWILISEASKIAALPEPTFKIARGSIWGLVLWWPPSEYAHVCTSPSARE